MKKIRMVSTLVVLLLLLSGISLAEDLAQIMDSFYTGLADIIERNMNDPTRCVREVERYYQANQATVERIRQETEKAMDEYKSMSAEELAAVEKRMQEDMAFAGTTRYAQALQAFIMKHPREGTEIAGQAMQLLPAIGQQSYEQMLRK